ncbi:MAG: hypothetical protein COW24_02945 [Candidatus Kerfeldbacteria bacterium CG15_BIG_FIL_POST_REV_8_21_14_020_45_12]|uniref:Uncharacterized protein n=1 Tax=Candidatus Kerfeldbacteria bacterium CG15_BIG_FIL_POST_REV_8_21_14_020_45_12 TaxID=2014247 RepID=A0A2M7H3S9_9BACT|nr:MAG: hypothetical protein COW24_02945 [Candidatus Kerfeldbacteria bacterium CG15_BIG_FIL_POST_REV_8_21_14_020_45_12]PJA94014.1 MAG: hypothetical protein CO132_00515 [Candidatus Kerfeldbacteria bacterium CG_4_9_14_3_um_filter_45_8]
MRVTKQDIFNVKTQLQQEIQQYEKQLQELIVKQGMITKVAELAQSILEYNELERNIGDRTYIFALLSSPPESLRNPLVKSNLFSYIEAAETVSVELVDFLLNDFIQQIKFDIQNGEDDDPGLVQAEYKEYIIPGKIIAERFDEIEPLLEEMNRFCKVLQPNYDANEAQTVLEYGIRKSISADTRMDPTLHLLKEVKLQYLTPEARARLVDEVEEHLAIIRFEVAKDQNIAMDKAITMLEAREMNHGIPDSAPTPPQS